MSHATIIMHKLFLDPGEYMSFGLSGDIDKTVMIGGDAVVAWVDPVDFQGHAEDYFLEGKSQCAGTRGSCPDNRIRVCLSKVLV
jgi:hypothetical protein